MFFSLSLFPQWVEVKGGCCAKVKILVKVLQPRFIKIVCLKFICAILHG